MFQTYPGAKHLFWFGKGTVENIFAIFISLSNPNLNSVFQSTKTKQNETKWYTPLTPVLLLHSLYSYSTCVSSSITYYSLS